MSVSALSENPYAYMDRLHEGGATIHYSPAEGRATPAPSVAAAEDTTAPAKDGEEFSMFGKDGFGFDDFLDIINPLQHIPVISTLYREITGDELSAGARMIGGGIFGGGVGLAASIVNTAIETQTGKDIGDHVVAMFSDDENVDPVQIAAAKVATEAVTEKPAADAAVSPSTASATLPSGTPSPAEPQLSMIMPASLMKHAASQRSDSIEPAVASDAAKPNAATAGALAMGLEWKNSPATNVHQTIEKIREQKGDNLTSDQLARILGSFKQPAPAAAVEPKKQQSSEKPDTVSDITPANRSQALQSYERGADIAALPQNNYYNFGSEATR